MGRYFVCIPVNSDPKLLLLSISTISLGEGTANPRWHQAKIGHKQPVRIPCIPGTGEAAQLDLCNAVLGIFVLLKAKESETRNRGCVAG